MNEPELVIQRFQQINEKRKKLKSERIYRVYESRVQRLYKDSWEDVCEHDDIMAFDNCVKCKPKPKLGIKKSGTSYLACQFMDLLEKELGVSIQHAHYNLETMLVDGSEYKIHNLRVDGFYVDADNEQVAVEFLGDVWHGHPSLWGKKNRWGVDYKTLFQSTEERFQKICQLGYRVIYVWQKDFKKRDETQRLPIKTFQGELV